MSVSSSPLTPTSEHKNFSDHFWGSDRNITEGVNVLHETVKISHVHSKLLHDILKEHAEIEQKYNANFQKLLTKLPTDIEEEKNTFAPAWSIINKFYNTFFDFHSDHVRNLNSVVKSFTNYISEEKKNFNSLVKNHEQSQHLKQTYTKSFNNYSESKSQFYIASQELFKNYGENDQESTLTKDEFDKSKEEYKTHLNKHSDSVQHLTMKIKEIFLEYEMFEKDRLKQLIEYSTKFIKYSLSHFFGGVNVVNVPIEALKTINVENSLIEFAKKFGTKGLRPISPIYKDPPAVPGIIAPLANKILKRSSSSFTPNIPSHPTEKPLKSSKPKQSINILRRKRGKQTNVPEITNSSNPRFDAGGNSPKQSIQTTSTEELHLPEGVILDEEGNRIRVESINNEQNRKFSYSSSDDSDSNKYNKIKKIVIKPKEDIFEKSVDANTLKDIIGNIKLGTAQTNLSNKKFSSADCIETSSHRVGRSMEGIYTSTNRSNQKDLEDLFTCSTLSESHKKRTSMGCSVHLDSESDKVDGDNYRNTTPTLLDPCSALNAAFPIMPAPPPLPSTLPMIPTPVTSPYKIVTVDKDDVIHPSIQVESSGNDSKADFLFTNNFELNGITSQGLTHNLSTVYVPSNSRLSMPLPPTLLSPSNSNSDSLHNSTSVPDLDSIVLRPKVFSISPDRFQNRSVQIIHEEDIRVSSDEERDSPDLVKRPDSSLSFTSDATRSLSPGIDTIAIAVQLQEKIHVCYLNNKISEHKYIKLEGNLTFAFLSTSLNNLIEPITCTLNAGNQLSLYPTDSNIVSVKETNQLNFDMDALKTKLFGMQAENNSNSLFLVLPILNYLVKIPTSSPPIILHCVWTNPSVDQTCVEIEYCYNHEAFPISPFPDIDDVTITVNYVYGNVTKFESEPKAMWNKFDHKAFWKIDSISSSLNSKVKLIAQFDHFPDEELKQNIEVSFSCKSILSGLTVTFNARHYRVAKLKQRLVSGVYKSTVK